MMLWRKVLQATIDTLRGASRGQYGITLANPKGIDEFLAGHKRVEMNAHEGFSVSLPVEGADGPPAVPPTTMRLVFNGRKDLGVVRQEWRIPNQRPSTAYPLWRLGVGLQEETQPGEDFIIVVRDEAGKFHLRWLRGADVNALSPSVAARLRRDRPASGVEDLSRDDLRVLAMVTRIRVGMKARADAEATEDKQGVFAEGIPAQAGDIGQAYLDADEDRTSASPAAPIVDPDKRERGNRGHATTQNAVAAFLRGEGLAPLSPVVGDPNFDLAWVRGDVLFVAEVKSLTAENEEGQLRLGLGQVLRYAHLLRRRGLTVEPVLAVERAPTDPTWEGTCAENGVVLVYPGTFEKLV